MTNFSKCAFPFLLVLAAMLGGGCSNEIGELIECAQVCESYDDCVDDAYDQTECTDRCEDYADVSDANETQVFDCDDCFNELECSADCNSRCAGITPPL